MKIVFVGHVCVDQNVVRGETETLYGGGVVHGAITAQRLGAEATVVTKCAGSDRSNYRSLGRMAKVCACAPAASCTRPHSTVSQWKGARAEETPARRHFC